MLDGTALYVDRNANSDLTEPGERLEPDNPKDGSNRFGGSGSHTHFDTFRFTIRAGTGGSSQFQLDHWIRAKNFTPRTDFEKEVFARRQELGYENSTLWRKSGLGQGQTPLLFMPDPKDAQVCALDGKLTFVVKLPQRQILKRSRSEWDLAFHIAVPGRSPREIDRLFYNPLATQEVPEAAHLDVTIDYPTAGDSPLRLNYLLRERC